MTTTAETCTCRHCLRLERALAAHAEALHLVTRTRTEVEAAGHEVDAAHGLDQRIRGGVGSGRETNAQRQPRHIGVQPGPTDSGNGFPETDR
jgi:hypothetical protein